MCECEGDGTLLQSFILLALLAAASFSFSLHLLSLVAVASCVLDSHLVTLVMVVPSRVVSCGHALSLAQSKKYAGGETPMA